MPDTAAGVTTPGCRGGKSFFFFLPLSLPSPIHSKQDSVSGKSKRKIGRRTNLNPPVPIETHGQELSTLESGLVKNNQSHYIS
jgi:hypothetical protein